MTTTPHRSRWLRPLLLAANFVAPFSIILTEWHSPVVTSVAFLMHGLLLYSLVVPSCDWLAPVVTRFEPRGREVWLTIDDGLDGDRSVRLAQMLASRGVRATFFVKGESIVRQPEPARAILAAGQMLANHSHTHPAWLFWCLPRARMIREIGQCTEALQNAGAEPVGWFRPPAGLKNIFLAPELRRRGLRIIGWSVRGMDGVVCEPDAVIHRVTSAVKPGDIILVHEGKADRRGKASSHDCIERLMEELTRAGFTFVIPDDEQLR